MCAEAAERHDEGVETVTLALRVQLSQHDGVVGRLTHCTRDPGVGGDRKETFIQFRFDSRRKTMTSQRAVGLYYVPPSLCLRPPGHHLMEVTVGLCIMNSCVAGSNVAVVSSPRR